MLGDSTLDGMIAKFAVDEGLLLPEDVERAKATSPAALTETLRTRLSPEQITRLTQRAGAPALSEQVREALLDPKRKIGKYVLLDEIGRGGMGIVRRGWDTTLERHVAVKCLPTTAGEEDLARFRREAQTAAKLNHPNIVPVHEILDHEGTVFVVMELIDGKRLDQDSLDSRGVASAIRDAANAIHFAHAKGIVHRDLKPANIMRDGSGRVWVMDFGLARPVTKGTTLTATGIVQGTPSYMSPEHATAAPYGPRADVYSLGATLYDLLTGKLPFEGENPLDILHQIVHDDPVPPRKHKASIPADLETITLKCLEKKPERRYASAEELAKDLDRWLKGEAIHAHPPSTLRKIAKFVKTRRVPIGAVLLVLAVAGTFGAMSMQRAGRVRGLIEAGGVSERSGALEAARDSYRSALDLSPNDPEAKAGVERTEAGMRERDARLKAEAAAVRAKLQAREEATGLLEKARIALDQAARRRYERREYADVIESVGRNQPLIEEAIAKAPDLAVAHHLLGRSWSLRGEDDRSEASWRKAIEIDARYAAPHLELGRLMLFRGFDAMLSASPEEAGKRNQETADRCFTEAARELKAFASLALDSSPPLAVELAQAMEAYARHEVKTAHDLAVAGAERYGSAEGVEEFYWLQGLVRGHTDQALTAYTRALAIRPHFFEALYERGGIHQVTGNYESALQDFGRALALKPRYAPAWMQRGLALRKLGKFEKAKSDIEHACEIDPADSWARLNLGIVHLDLKMPEKAEEILTEAIRREPGWAPLYEMRAVAKSMQGREKEAVEDFTRSIDIHPTSRAFMNRAESKVTLDDAKGALDDFREAAALAPEGSPTRERCLKRVKDLTRAY